MRVLKQRTRILLPTTDEAARMLKVCEYGGRNCYNSVDKITDDSATGFLKGLIKRGHESPIEHSLMVAELLTSRDVMAELTRHRHCGFSIRSQRYVNESGEDGVAFIEPVGMTEEWFDAWANECLASECAYAFLKEKGLKNEDARKVLNNSVATNIVMSANLREWRHVFKMRTTPNVYPETRWLMLDLLAKAKELFPGIFDDIGGDET